jgi:hypothetical protein
MFVWMTDPLSTPLPKLQDYCGDNDCRYEDDRMRAMEARYRIVKGNSIMSTFAYGSKWNYVGLGMAEKEAGDRVDRELVSRIHAMREFQVARDKYELEKHQLAEMERGLYGQAVGN